MSRAFLQPDGNAPGGTTAVWSDADGTALLFVESLNVNTDGTRRSYSVGDFWGETTALNNLCNAMTDACAGLSKEQKKTRKVVTQKALADGWPADELRRSKISSQIIPFKAGKPCPLIDGFMVSATALHKPAIQDVCDITNYVDALTVPALVLPGGANEFRSRGARVGDLVVAVTPGGADPVYAVVGDTGPPGELGEGSVALNGRLLGKTAAPTNYKDVKRGWVVPHAIVLIFPSSRDATRPYMTTARIDEAGKPRFEAWGGMPRLKACAEQYATAR